MSGLMFPWLELAISLPLIGGAWVHRIPRPEQARRHCIAILTVTFLLTLGAAIDFSSHGALLAQHAWSRVLGPEFVVVDELNAPLLPLVSLLFLLTAVATLRTKVRRFSFAWSLMSESLLLAAFACRSPWAVIGLLSLGTVIPWLVLKTRHQPTRMYTIYMSLFVGCMVLGQAILTIGAGSAHARWLGLALLAVAVAVRSGIVPFHSWLPDLFQRATFGTALLFAAPMPGVYAATRLLLPIAPDWALHSIGLMSLLTALYAAGMALVQQDSRRFYSFLFLSHSALVLVGLEVATPIGLTGALTLWLSVGLALGGFGLTLRGIEARLGWISMAEYHGLSQHAPTLAAFFLLTGLASVGFPGTFGFVGAELIVEGAVQIYPYVGMAVVVAAALNGIAVVMAYLRIFTGTQHRSSIDLRIRIQERLAVLILSLLILGAGLWPQPGIASRYHAAMAVINGRRPIDPDTPAAPRANPRDSSATNTDGWQLWLMIGGSKPQSSTPVR